MSKTYKLKRAYSLAKFLAALGIAFMFIYKLVELSYSGTGDAGDLVILLVCGISIIHHTLSYMKVNMEKEDHMERLIRMVNDNERRSKINRKLIARNTKRIKDKAND